MRPLYRSFIAALLLVASAPLRAVDSPSTETRATWTTVEYGTQVPTLSCSPLGACMVALEDGEIIESRFLADSARWEIQPGTTGSVPLVAIKPRECNIATNLFITTDRRIYTLLLSAPPCDPGRLNDPSTIRFDQVRYSYPEAFRRFWQPSAPSAPAVATAARSVSNLNFSYSWSAGRKAPEPTIVYDDGARVYVVLERIDPAIPTPAVFVRGDQGKLEAVNFNSPSPGSSTFTVDRIADELVLVTGPSRSQQTTIHRKVRR